MFAVKDLKSRKKDVSFSDDEITKKFIIYLKTKSNKIKQPSRSSWLGGFRAFIVLCVYINTDIRFQFYCDAVTPDGYLFDQASYPE